MDVRVDKVDQAHIVRVSGEVDFYTVGKLHDALASRIDGRALFVIVDLQAVDYLGTPGIAELVNCLKGMRAHGGRFRLMSPKRHVHEAIELANLDGLFDICETEEEALS